MGEPVDITNQKTPIDQNGNQISDGNWYRLTRGRGKPSYVLVRYQVDTGEYVCQGRGAGLWQRVDEMADDIHWELITEDEIPCM